MQSTKQIPTLFLLALTYLFIISCNPQKKGIDFDVKLLCIDTNEFCEVGDVNKDGHMDVVAGRSWYAGPDFISHPLRDVAPQAPDYSNNNGEFLYDVDQDGWLDLLSSGYSNPTIRWYKNSGEENLKKGMLWEEQVLVDTKQSQNEISYFQDLNGDQIPEWIVGSWKRDNPMTVWYLAKAEGTKEEKHVLQVDTIGLNNSHGSGFGDMNNDGRLDILFDDGWYEQPAMTSRNQLWTRHADWKLEGGSCPILAVDLDEDGDKEIIWGRGHSYGLFWMEEVTKGEWKQHIIDTTWSQVHAMDWVDLDGDGTQELLTGKRYKAHSGKDPGSDDPVSLFLYRWDNSNKEFHKTTLHTGNVGTGLIIRTADMNQDHLLDIVVAGKSGTYILFQE